MPSKKKLIEQRKKYEAEKKKNEEMQVKQKKDKNDISKLVSEVDMLLDKNILFDNQNTELTKELNELKEKTNNLQIQHELLVTNHKELQENYDSCSLKLKEVQQKYDVLLSKNNEDVVVIENNRVEIASLRSRLTTLESAASVIDGLTENVRSLNLQLENERLTHTNELEKEKANHDNQVASMSMAHTNKVDSMQKDQENHVAFLKETHKIEVEKIISEMNEQENLLKENHKKDIEELTKALQEQEISLKLAHNEDVERLEKTLKDMESSLRMAHREEVDFLKKELENQEVSLKNVHESDVNILKKELVDLEIKLKNAHQIEVNNYQKELKDQEVSLKTTHEKDTNSLKAKLKKLKFVVKESHEKFDENLKNELENRQLMFQQEVARLQQDHSNNLEILTKKYEDQKLELEKNLEKCQEKINNSSNKVEELKNVINVKEEELSNTNQLLDETRNTLNKQNNNIMTLQSEKIALKEEITVLQGIHDEESNLISNLHSKLSENEILLLQEKELCHKQEKQIEVYKVLENEKEVIESQLADIKDQLGCTKIELTETTTLLESIKNISDERYSQIIEMGQELSKLSNEVLVLAINKKENEDLINGLRNQLLKETSLMLKEHDLRMKQEQELQQLIIVKEEKKQVEEEMYHMRKQFEMKNLKLKLLRTKMQNTCDQKEKAESVLFLLPEMQKKIDFLDKEKQKLEKNIEEQSQKEKEKLALIAIEKQEKEEQIKLQKEDWEKRMLGIGRCMHSEFDNVFNFKNRPKSAPSIKPKPPTTGTPSTKPPTTGRRYMNGVRKHKVPTLNPSFLEASIDTNWQSIGLPVLTNNYLKESFSSDTHLPTTKLKPTQAFQQILKDRKVVQPRILVLENEEETSGKRLLAVGDKVSAKLKCNCSLHNGSFEEHMGTVAFIGFVDGNDVDVYVGLEMDDDVGYTDGKINGKRYFRCEAQKGRFVRFNDIRKYNDISHVKPLFLNTS